MIGILRKKGHVGVEQTQAEDGHVRMEGALGVRLS